MKKSLGQNFLIDKNVIADLVEATEVGPQDSVLEVGAGSGNVTRALAKCARSVIAVEFDKDLIPLLKKNLEGVRNVKIVQDDILKFLATSYQLPVRSYKVVGSIPYQITSPLIHKLLTLTHLPSLITLIIQKEVAGKIVAKPPKASYLSNFVKATAFARIIREVPKDAFYPRPEVDGAIVKLEVRKQKTENRIDLEKWSAFLHQGFKYPRKMMRKKFDKEVLERVGIDPACRAENLTLKEWVKLFTLR